MKFSISDVHHKLSGKLIFEAEAELSVLYWPWSENELEILEEYAVRMWVEI
jgi:hypothetical protein